MRHLGVYVLAVKVCEELRNVGNQNICHGNSDIVGRGLQYFICGKGFEILLFLWF